MVREPRNQSLPATLQSSNNTGNGFDYSLGVADQDAITALFFPNETKIPFTFLLNNDSIAEGLEAFVVFFSPTPNFVAVFQLTLSSIFDSHIFILDDDGE